jgi:hypothetical protein
VDIGRFTERLEAMMDRVPPALLRDLDGGVSVSEHEQRRRGDPPGVYVLGEYITDPYLGRLIVMYYGSFRRLFAGEAEGVWDKEMWDTLRHEIRHHVEGLAGVSDLDVEDLQQLERMRAETAAGPRRVRRRRRRS